MRTWTKFAHGDCLEQLKKLPDCSVDLICTDPPYGLTSVNPKQPGGETKIGQTGRTRCKDNNRRSRTMGPQELTMQYRDILAAIEQTERRLKLIQDDCHDLRLFFERHGCYDEDDAQDLWDKQTTVYEALNHLYAQLPYEATL